MGVCESVDEAVGEIIGTGFARVHFNAIIVVIITIIDIAEMTASRARIVSTASVGFFPPIAHGTQVILNEHTASGPPLLYCCVINS